MAKILEVLLFAVSLVIEMRPEESNVLNETRLVAALVFAAFLTGAIAIANGSCAKAGREIKS
jgi:hypothetical protein